MLSIRLKAFGIQEAMKHRLALGLGLLLLSAAMAPQSMGDLQLAQLIERGRTSLDQATLGQARDMAAAQTQQHPESAEAFYQLARVNSYRSDAYAMRHDKKNAEKALDEAIANLQQSLRLNEKSADAHSLLADCYGRKIGLGIPMFTGPKFGPKVQEENQRALELDANNPRAHASLGRQYFEAPKMFGGDLEKAVAEFRKAIELDPKSDETFVWLAMALRKKGDASGAQQAIESALRLNPESVFAKSEGK
jgi:tetratricopeptide (TPR) repeat protein